MKKIKMSFPFLLLLIVSVFNLKSIFFALRYFNLFSLLEALCPIVLLLLLFLQTKGKDCKQLVGASGIIFGIAHIITALSSIPYLGQQEFIFDLTGGNIYNLVTEASLGILLLIMGLYLLRNKTMPPYYTFLFGLGVFLSLYGSAFLAFENPFMVMKKIPVCLFLIAIFYLPRLYDEDKKTTTEITSKKIKVVGIAVIVTYALLIIAYMLSGASSPQTGYWGSDGYYNPTDEEMEDVWDDVDDWMAENWN